MTPVLGTVWIVGPGRIGRALGSQLQARGLVSDLYYLYRDGDSSGRFHASHPPLSPPDLVLLTVRDDDIAAAADRLLGFGLPPATVLHTSGALSSSVLADLGNAGWEVGSMAPVVSVADPVADAPKLLGAWYAIEGAEGATRVAHRIVAGLQGHPMELTAEAKPVYHAAAVFASNYLVTLMETAERLMADAGVDRQEARQAMGELAAGSLENVRLRGPTQALSGPISRGDLETVRTHLGRLSPLDRGLYSVLAAATLKIATEKGLRPEAVLPIERMLSGEQE